MGLAGDVGGLVVLGVGVHALGHAVGKSSKKLKTGLKGKGYHQHSLEHSENARKHYWLAGNNSGYSLFKTKKQATTFKNKTKLKSVKVSKVIV